MFLGLDYIRLDWTIVHYTLAMILILILIDKLQTRVLHFWIFHTSYILAVLSHSTQNITLVSFSLILVTLMSCPCKIFLLFYKEIIK